MSGIGDDALARTLAAAEAPDGAAPPRPAAAEADPAAPASSMVGLSGSQAGARTSISDEAELPVSVADPLIGKIIADRYRIVELIGRGGMGIVYKVEHTRIGKLLAMKLLAGELTQRPEVVRRFKQEALTASRLSSLNTVQVFDFGVSEGLTYLVMELVAGEDLGRLLRAEGAMPFQRLGKIIIQVCSSLSEAHQQGIVHRDVKPENVMILRGQGGTDLAKVLDFGLAKLREGSELNAVTSQGAIVGTPYFMSPEQVRGEAVDARSDIYALGAVMYRALTGHYAFNGPTPMAVFTKHLTELPPPPDERAPERGIPAAVSRIVMQALAKSPSDRFQRVEDLQAALVAEVRALGTSSVEELLDSGALRRLAQPEAQAASPQRAAEIATRDEVAAYERKLRRMRYTALATVAVVALVAGAVGARLVALSARPRFSGLEVEPNDAPADALVVPLGRGVSGYVGRRIDAARGDRDFYAFDVPEAGPGAPAHVRLTLTALPNFPICALLYRAGLQTPLGQYCAGRAGRDLAIPALRVEPGRYLVAVLQDLDPYGGSTPFRYENVSDAYTLQVDRTEPDPAVEIEPDDQVASAVRVLPGDAVSGALAWTRDEDVYCVPAGTAAPIRWIVRDGPRDSGVVLEATPLRGSLEGAPVRIHGAVVPGRELSDADALNPWTSPLVMPGEADRCLRVRLANDTWNNERGNLVPSGSSEPYTVEVIAAP